MRTNAAVARTDHWINPVRPAAILAVAFLTRRNIFGIGMRVSTKEGHTDSAQCAEPVKACLELDVATGLQKHAYESIPRL